jgi:hypothetical protein
MQPLSFLLLLAAKLMLACINDVVAWLSVRSSTGATVEVVCID